MMLGSIDGSRDRKNRKRKYRQKQGREERERKDIQRQGRKEVTEEE